MKKPIVALIYDFDGTLAPGNMQEFGFIQAVGSTPAEFWAKSNQIAVGQDASNVLAYMKLMFDEARNEYGRSKGVKVEHYINSSGLKEIVEGTTIAKEFRYIFAGSFIYDANGEAVWPGIAVDSTNKTQFLFKINKGIFSARDSTRLNSSMAEEKKRVPFPNMIYFGDGETDVPCMKIVGMFGGHSIAVYKQGDEKKRALARKLKKQGRVKFAVPANYSADSEAFKVVCAIIDKIKAETVLQSLMK